MQEKLLITIEIKPNTQEEDSWYLEIINTLTAKVFNAQNLEAMNEVLETLYSLYPGSDLEVRWLPSQEASPAHINEVRTLINKMQEEMN
jgi:hypothetical protein